MIREEEKQLLHRVLCAMLLYKVKVYNTDTICSLMNIGVDGSVILLCEEPKAIRSTSIEFIKPYLRPMSSMTEEEKKEYERLFENVHWVTSGLEDISILSIDFMECYDNDGDIRNIYDVIPIKAIDWLNEHHFDYRGLIYKGLALEAKEGMYK